MVKHQGYLMWNSIYSIHAENLLPPNCQIVNFSLSKSKSTICFRWWNQISPETRNKTATFNSREEIEKQTADLQVEHSSNPKRSRWTLKMTYQTDLVIFEKIVDGHWTLNICCRALSSGRGM
jgi:hypothetical protein